MTSTPKRRRSNDRFVVDGPERLRRAAEPKIRAQVVAEYAARFDSAGLWSRFWLRLKINREVSLRLSKINEPKALY